MLCLLFPELYPSIIHAKPVFVHLSNVQQEMEFHCAVCYLLNSIFYQCKTSFIHFPNVQQEIEFQLGSALPVRPCKMASLSFTSRPKHCAVYYLLNSFYFTITNSTIKMQNQFFFKCATGNGISTWLYTPSKIMQIMPVSYKLPDLNIVQYFICLILSFSDDQQKIMQDA